MTAYLITIRQEVDAPDAETAAAIVSARLGLVGRVEASIIRSGETLSGTITLGPQ